MSNHVIHVKSCHLSKIMSFMSNHAIHDLRNSVKSGGREKGMEGGQICLPKPLKIENHKENILQKKIKNILRGRLHGAISMCVFMSDKPIVAEACPPMSHASADIETHILNAPCNRPKHNLKKTHKNKENKVDHLMH
jgi:hypothetical protein